MKENLVRSSLLLLSTKGQRRTGLEGVEKINRIRSKKAPNWEGGRREVQKGIYGGKTEVSDKGKKWGKTGEMDSHARTCLVEGSEKAIIRRKAYRKQSKKGRRLVLYTL